MSQIHTGTVKYEIDRNPSEFVDRGYGPSTSLAVELPNQQLARFYVKAHQTDKLAQYGKYTRGMQVQVLEKGDGKYELLDDGLPFDPPAAQAVPHQPPVASQKKNLIETTKYYTNVMAGCYGWLHAHYAQMIQDETLDAQHVPPDEAIAAQASTVLIQLAREGLLR